MRLPLQEQRNFPPCFSPCFINISIQKCIVFFERISRYFTIHNQPLRNFMLFSIIYLLHTKEYWHPLINACFFIYQHFFFPFALPCYFFVSYSNKRYILFASFPPKTYLKKHFSKPFNSSMNSFGVISCSITK